MKLLGVDIDFNLKFGSHIQNICKKAGQQLNVSRRIGKNLCKLRYWSHNSHCFKSVIVCYYINLCLFLHRTAKF